MPEQPFDFSAMIKMFDPDQISKMFDPERIKAAFTAPEVPAVDFNAALESNEKNFEAMRAANTAATEAYRDFYQKQMTIFEELMRAAKEKVDSQTGLPGADAAKNAAETYRVAMEKALENMTNLAIATKEANEDAFAIIQDRVKKSITELKGT